MRIYDAFEEGRDLVVTIVCKPDLGDDLVGFGRFTVVNSALANEPEIVETLMAYELLRTVREVYRYCDDEGVPVQPDALWRAWAHFEDPFSPPDKFELVPSWNGEW